SATCPLESVLLVGLCVGCLVERRDGKQIGGQFSIKINIRFRAEVAAQSFGAQTTNPPRVIALFSTLPEMPAHHCQM
ncbi:hypothetical protein, partial [Aquicoccus sp.]|uniref:hypothetical protein n=1 Tax=Aquicoccus sp. TaxID=2055851 RepID=UPI00356969DF